jgi:hypothetical protein
LLRLIKEEGYGGAEKTAVANFKAYNHSILLEGLRKP